MDSQKTENNEPRLDSGVEIKPVYTSKDVKADHSRNLGLPGQYPFIRGNLAEIDRDQPWDMDMYSGYDIPELVKDRYKFLLDVGATGVSIALDLPTQVGYDADDPRSRGEVGKVGVNISSLRDLEILFDEIPLDKIKWVFTTGNSIGPIVLAWFIALGKKKGIPADKYRIRLQNHPVKELTGRGTYIFPIEDSFRLSLDVAEYTARNFPHWKGLQLCGGQYRAGGANAAQEIGFLVSESIEYIKALLERGVGYRQFVSTMELHPTIKMNFFEELAKIRAFRGVWARTVKDRFGLDASEMLMPQIVLVTSPETWTRDEPANNISRLTLVALSAVLAGCQVLIGLAPDEVIGLPTQEAKLSTLRVQQIVAFESGVTSTMDPLGGSYYVESLTSVIAERAVEFMKHIEAKGGLLNYIKTGELHMELSRLDYLRQKEYDAGKRLIVGLNKYPLPQGQPYIKFNRFITSREAETMQVEKLKKLRQERDNGTVEKALKEVKRVAASKKENIVPSVLAAVDSYATIGELCNTLRSVFGEYREQGWKF